MISTLKMLILIVVTSACKPPCETLHSDLLPDLENMNKGTNLRDEIFNLAAVGLNFIQTYKLGSLALNLICMQTDINYRGVFRPKVSEEVLILKNEGLLESSKEE